VSHGSNETYDAGGLTPRAMAAFDLLAGYHQTLGLAVSGGSDSLSLLVLAVEWARDRGRGVVAATVDHGLRPEALAEAEGVAAICAQLGVPHDILTWSHFGRSGGAPGQAEARRARHALLAGWALARDVGIIALGHTRDDRIETFLMRARQGSGWHGLAGPLAFSALAGLAGGTRAAAVPAADGFCARGVARRIAGAVDRLGGRSIERS
jgi:tRNA(Ile)-lysidine synthase